MNGIEKLKQGGGMALGRAGAIPFRRDAGNYIFHEFSFLYQRASLDN